MTKEQIEQMKEAMDTIGKICGKITSWDECRDCPFDDYCTAINDAYWEHDWHDMEQTFCLGLREKDVVLITLKNGGFRELDILDHAHHLKVGHTWNDEHMVVDVVSEFEDDDGHHDSFSVDLVTGRICG